MDLGRPIARHFARRPHEVEETASSRTSPRSALPDTSVRADDPGTGLRPGERAQAASAPTTDGARTERTTS
ncbi:MAG: hypothetical protein WA892_09990 [Ornithinimicrobium sp.]